MLPGRSTASFLLALLVLSLPASGIAKDEKDPIVVQDPQYGEVLFYFYQEDYFPAIVRTLAAQQEEQLEAHKQEAELLLGGMYLSYGHHLEAADIFERLLADNVSTDVRDRTWFFLGKIWYQRGYLDKAQEALGLIEGELPKNLQREALMLEAQILLDAGDYDAAIALLQKWKGKTEWASYAKFNIGVALVRSGRVAEAQSLLEDLGSLNPFNEELTSLRDKANLALGYALLQDGQPFVAKAPLQRVRLEGPFSNKALLGVGWADAELGNFQRALVPWMELRSRDLLDSAVQESMLAIPYAMAKLDSISQAADHYLNAIEAFYEETNRLDRTISHIESGAMFEEFLNDGPLDSTGWYWRLEELPEGPESRYLFHLLASHEFQEGLKNYRDLSYLHENLDAWQDSVSVYGNMLETRKQAFDIRLPEVEDALARADLDGMVSRKLEFDSRLNNIEQSSDWLALATKSEFEMWGEITGLESTPALRANIPEAAEVRDKISLLKGVLQWELERDFKDRLWRIRRNLDEAGEALVATQRSRRQIDDTIRNEPVFFAELSGRVYGLEPRVEGMKMRVEDSLAAQRRFLQEIAVGELQAQKQRLDVYTVQAQFALAAIYDLAATTAEAGE
ncbi:MAG: tetratricopeptide repeat protein [Gammaproteobacteria bacterium]|nr:tetratricopeptide repeat protein [Gammaproteobacteria bacterium]